MEARHAVIEFSKHLTGSLRLFVQSWTNALFLVRADSEKYYTVDDQIPKSLLFDELSDFFKTKDGHVRLHANFPQ